MSKPLAFAAIVFTFAVGMLGTTMPTPIYSLYQAEFGFSLFVVTVIYAAYAIGVLAALLAFGRWSDSLGRRPMLLAGIAFAIASALVFVFADSLTSLLVGRVLSGVSAGIFVGTATVTLIEMAPETWRPWAPFVATAANIGGLGLGPLVAGILVEYAPAPLRLPFYVDIALLLVGAVAVVLVPETVAVKKGARPHMQRLALPAEIRGTFARSAIAGFAGFAVLGLYTAVTPGFLGSVLGIDNHALGGLVVFAMFFASASAQIALRSLPVSLALKGGCGVLILGVAFLGIALSTASLVLLIISAVVCGVGQGVTFSKGIAAVTGELPPDRRAEVTSTFFVVLYIALSVPVIGAGAAANAWGLVTAGIVFSIIVALLAAISIGSLVVEDRRTSAHNPIDGIQDEKASENS